MYTALYAELLYDHSLFNSPFTLTELTTRPSRGGTARDVVILKSSYKNVLRKRLGKLSVGICEQTEKEIINGADVYILCIKPDETKVT